MVLLPIFILARPATVFSLGHNFFCIAADVEMPYSYMPLIFRKKNLKRIV
jgi:hypothetical protein